MSSKSDVWSAQELRDRYGAFYAVSPRVQLDRSKVPERFWCLLPYAEFWGLPDDSARDPLIEQAPAAVRENLKAVVRAFDADLSEWLAGPESYDLHPSPEYVAYTAMLIASDTM